MTAAPEPRVGRVAPVGPPGWFDALVVLSIGVPTLSGLGVLVLSMAGRHSTPAAVAICLAVVAALGFVLNRLERADEPSSSPAALICVLVVVAVVGFWASQSSQQVVIERDPGSYVATARWISATGTLVLDTSGDPFEGYWEPEPGVSTTPGESTRKVFQFNHLFPAVLSLGFDAGGHPLLFRMPALLTGAGLLALYAVGVRLVRRPWLPLVPVTVVATSAPFLAVGREALSESLTFAMVWGAAALALRLVGRGDTGAPGWLVLGGLLGALVSVRVDGLVYLAVAAPLLAAWVVGSARSGSARSGLARRRAVGWLLVSLIPTTVVGVVDLERFTGRYVAALASQITALRALAVVAVMLSVVAVVVLSRARGPLPAIDERLAEGSAVLVAAGFLALWWVRPLVDTGTGRAVGRVGGLQEIEGVALDPTRNYREMTMEWVSWYLGPVVVLLGVLGVALLVRRMLLGRSTPAELFVTVLFVMAGVYYLWRPSITPDHLWAMRRFVPVVLPGLALLAIVPVAMLVETRAPRRPVVRVASVVIACAMVLGSSTTTVPIASHRAQGGFLAAVEGVCDEVGADGVILLPQGRGWAAVPQTFRSWCGVPVAVAPARYGPDAVVRLAGEWQRSGRQLFLVTQETTTMERFAPAGGTTVWHGGEVVNSYRAAASVERPPTGYAPEALQFHVLRVQGDG